MLIKDSDSVLRVQLKDKNREEIDLTSVTDIIAKIYQKGRELKKYSLQNQSGFGKIKKFDAALGKIDVFLNGEDLEDGLNNQNVFLEVKYQEANVDFDGGQQEVSTAAICLGSLCDSELIDETYS